MYYEDKIVFNFYASIVFIERATGRLCYNLTTKESYQSSDLSRINDGWYSFYTVDMKKGVYSGDKIQIMEEYARYRYDNRRWVVYFNGVEAAQLEEFTTEVEEYIKKTTVVYTIPFDLSADVVDMCIAFLADLIVGNENRKVDGYDASCVFAFDFKVHNGKRYKVIDVGDHYEVIWGPIEGLGFGSSSSMVPINVSMYNQYGLLEKNGFIEYGHRVNT